MNSGTIIIVVIVAVIVVVALGVAIQKQLQKKRSERLQEQFGPEYDRAVKKSDDPRAAEGELLEREKRHKKLELRTLDADQRRDYEQRWTRVQADFVDDPSRAVRDADHLVVDVMSARGYPVDDFDQRADDLSVDYPVVTENYRKARTVARANERGEAGTEDQRNAVTSYRSLVDALLHDDARDGTDGSGTHRADGAGRSDHGDRNDRVERSDRGDRADHVDRADEARPDRDSRVDRSQHDDRADHGRNGHRTAEQRPDRAMDTSTQEGSA
jgi:hypothetical protein